MSNAKLAFSTRCNSFSEQILHSQLRKEGEIMKKNKFWAAVSRTLALAAVALIVIVMLAPRASAQGTEKLLYSFTGGQDGQTPQEGVIFDQSGNLYGATMNGGDEKCYYGGIAGCGVVFQLTPNADGTWTENVLHSFTGRKDGAGPNWGSLVFGAANNLYGATNQGGSHNDGTIFELSPNSDGSWTESVLHQFTGRRDGAHPMTTPIFDTAGNLYGTAVGAGVYGCGMVFEMTPGSNNRWTYQAIHQFKGTPGCYPRTGLVPDTAGAYYGTTRNEGQYCGKNSRQCGIVYQLTPASGGKWTFKAIHVFSGGNGGADPATMNVVVDGNGNLYGTTWAGGGFYGYGLVYELSPGAGGKWTYKVLYQFTGSDDGGHSASTMIFDAAGNLYGTTWSGGAYGDGVMFKMTPNQNGTWTESVVYSFGGSDGANPGAALISDSAGNIYGTTGAGGVYGAGTVYEITP